MSTAAAHRAAFCRAITGLAGRHHLFDLFRDFCEMSALSLANAVDRRPALWRAREDRYLAVARRYNREELDVISELLAHVIDGMDEEPSDFLGQVFGELEQHNAARGQFFTPFEVSRVLARLTAGDRVKALETQRFIRLQEPSIGSGGMVLAFADTMRASGHNPQQQLHVVGVDIDTRAVHMAYIQLALAGIPAVLYVGNTLTMEMREEWKTPMHIMHGWDARLRASNEPVQQINDTTELKQVDIFGEVA